MDKHTQKVFLWGLLVVLVVLMSFGVYITHPVKNFDSRIIPIWIVILVVFLPISLLMHKFLRDKWIDKKYTDPEKLNKIRSKTDDFGNWSNCFYFGDPGCISGDTVSFGEFGIAIVGILAAALLGMFVGVILLGIEYILLKLMDLEPEPFSSPNLAVTAVNVLVIWYATYFIALFILLKILPKFM